MQTYIEDDTAGHFDPLFADVRVELSPDTLKVSLSQGWGLTLLLIISSVLFRYSPLAPGRHAAHAM
jgi:hypothetical protein